MKCLQCQKPTDNPKFCSRSCAVSYNNTQSPKRVSTKCKVKCVVCCEVFIPRRTTQVFCSRKCVAKHKTLTTYDRFELQGRFYLLDDDAIKNSKTVRQYLIHKHGNNCMLCGQSGDDWHGNSMTLIVDHIDGDAHNWLIPNVQLVCPNCDSQLPTYKSKNKGSGRYYRRERYKEEKSY